MQFQFVIAVSSSYTVLEDRIIVMELLYLNTVHLQGRLCLAEQPYRDTGGSGDVHIV